MLQPVNTGGLWIDQKAALLASQEFQPKRVISEADGAAAVKKVF